MDVTSCEKHGLLVIQVSGELDSTTAGDAEQEITRRIAEGTSLVLDLTKCRYISSAGLRVLLMIGKQLKLHGGSWALAGLSPEIIDIMEMTGFSTYFTICSTVGEAADSLSQT